MRVASYYRISTDPAHHSTSVDQQEHAIRAQMATRPHKPIRTDEPAIDYPPSAGGNDHTRAHGPLAERN